MDNIRVLRLTPDDHCDPSCRYVGIVQPDGGGWRLYVRDDGTPILQIAVDLGDMKGFVDVRDMPEYADEPYTPKAVKPWDEETDEKKLALWNDAREYAAKHPGFYVDEAEFGRLDMPAKCKRYCALHDVEDVPGGQSLG